MYQSGVIFVASAFQHYDLSLGPVNEDEEVLISDGSDDNNPAAPHEVPAPAGASGDVEQGCVYVVAF